MKTPDDYWKYVDEIQQETNWQSWYEFLDKWRKKKPQSWVVMDSQKFVTLVRKAYRGDLDDDDRRLIDEYVDTIHTCYDKLWFNCVMVGHTPEQPISFLRYDVLSDPEDWNPAHMQYLVEKCCNWIAEDAFSDYGMKPIENLLMPLWMQENYSLKMQIMTDIIGITHMRGDLSKFFVADGEKTHAQIDVYDREFEGADY